MDRRTVGILGGGQLGRMIIESANRLGVRIAVLDPGKPHEPLDLQIPPNVDLHAYGNIPLTSTQYLLLKGGPSSPAGQLSHLCIEGSYQDENRIRELASVSDIITTEIEHVHVEALQRLESTGSIVHPAAATLLVIQDKLAQKNHLHEVHIAQTEFAPIDDEQTAREFGMQHGYPFVLKNRKLAYDGRGNAVVNSASEVAPCFHKLGGVDLYAERMVPFAKELAVMVVRCKEGVFAYPVVETVQVNGICQVVSVPAQIGATAMNTAVSLAVQAVSTFEGYGVYGVEMFLLHDDSVLVNEIAPRPHNSGHYTIEACEVDQFEMHLRAVLGMPCPPPQLRVAAAMMVNVLGSDTMEATKEVLHRALTVPGASIHWYGKLENRPGRKMAHITVTAHSIAELRERVEKLGISAQLHRLPAAGPRVGVIMGSDSDLAVMKQAAEVLERFQVPYELTIVSAHRTPTRLYSYAQSAAERGLQVIIAGAGGAAHLPGMVAALCSLPVIGVPMHTAAFSGNDSLLSIVQMPRGVPVATVAIGNAGNAGLLAVRMLAAQDKALLAVMDDFMLKQEEEVLRKAAKLEAVGHEEYLHNQSR